MTFALFLKMDIAKNSITILINNLKIWQAKAWVKYNSDAKNIFLKLHYDHLIILSDSKVVESINCRSKIKGIYKEDNLLLIIGTATNEIRKIKFQIKDNLAKNLNDLGQHFPIINYNNREVIPTMKYRGIEEFITRVLEDKDKLPALPLPSTYNNFIKLCLLDPMFPQLVIQTQEIIQKELTNKNEKFELCYENIK